MSIESELLNRSGSQCELCSSIENLGSYTLPPDIDGSVEKSLMLCDTCREQIENPDKIDVNHWRCLNDSIWSPVAAVQVMAWRMLHQLTAEGWPQDLLEMLYLDDETLAWAKAVDSNDNQPRVKHLDSNGVVLQAGDNVTLIKDLPVKGANFTAKRGTAVRGISIVEDNPEQIEGRVNGQRIVILTKFVKKSS